MGCNCYGRRYLGIRSTSVDYLQRDIGVRFTGEFDYDNPITVGSGIYYPATAEGGSYAWIDGSRVGDFASHPDPANRERRSI